MKVELTKAEIHRLIKLGEKINNCRRHNIDISEEEYREYYTLLNEYNMLSQTFGEHAIKHR